MRQVAGVDQKLGPLGQGVDPVHGRLQGADDVLVRLLGETDVAIADLHEREVTFLGLVRILAENAGGQDSPSYGPGDARAHPGHALQKAAPVNAVTVMIVDNSSSHGTPPLRVRNTVDYLTMIWAVILGWTAQK